MPQAFVESNAPLVAQGLQDLAAEIPTVGRLQLYRTAQAIFRRSGVYPAKYLGQRYKRTMRLRQSRTLGKTENGYFIAIEPVDDKGRPYGVYVLGTAGDATRQARIHAGRWTPIAVITEEEISKLPRDVVAHLASTVQGIANATR